MEVISFNTFEPTSSKGPMAATIAATVRMVFFVPSSRFVTHSTAFCSAVTILDTYGISSVPMFSPSCFTVCINLRNWFDRLSPVRAKSPCAFLLCAIT